MTRLRSPLFLTALIGGASVLTVLSTASHAGPTSGRPTAYTAVEAVVTVVAVLAATLAAVRARALRRLDAVVLAGALATLAASHLMFVTVPSIVESDSNAWLWASACGRLLGAGMLSVAAVTPELPLERARVRATAALAAPPLGLAALSLTFAAVEPSTATAVAVRGELAGRMSIDLIHFATLVLFAVAAVAFARRWRHLHAQLIGWLAIASALAAVNRFDYLLDPASGLSAVRAGDALRVLVYLLVVLGLVRDAAGRSADEAVRRERRRIARDLHDGLAQELAFIARRAKGDGDGELAAAAERALFQSREAIAALRRPEAQSLEAALVAALDGLATRAGARLELDVAPVHGLTGEEREALVAIAREAVTNAARHAGAEVVRVELAESEGVRLRIVDDGSGFDLGARRRRGFGLDGMRERAEAVGAALEISSRPGAGTEVEVVLP